MAVEDAPSYAELQCENAELRRELAAAQEREASAGKEVARLSRDLTQAHEQHSATSEILRVIAGSPTDLQAVLDTVAENAARLCEANDAYIRLVEGDGTRLAASFGSLPAPEFRRLQHGPGGRAILQRGT